ncbi:hypothetical protein KA062_01270 [Patescibacteria group bacterium]|nr:hypothetical protein [Patescibacteria group bacterium]
MKKVKFFVELGSTKDCVKRLEEEANRWLESQKHDIKIIKIDFQTSRNCMYLLIFYKDTSIPLY